MAAVANVNKDGDYRLFVDIAGIYNDNSRYEHAEHNYDYSDDYYNYQCNYYARYRVGNSAERWCVLIPATSAFRSNLTDRLDRHSWSFIVSFDSVIYALQTYSTSLVRV